jgi:lipopolysaccharide export system protein LptA
VNRSCSNPARGVLATLALLFLFLSAPAALPAAAAEEADSSIHVTADVLKAEMDSNYAEFTGNVRSTRGDTVIESDKQMVYLKSEAERAKAGGTKGNAIEKIVAVGNVVFTEGTRKATADKAVYTADDGILILTGENAKVTTGESFVTGDRITLHIKDGRILVEGSKKRRVEAQFISGDKLQ